MVYRFLVGGDLHKRMKDITTIRGYAAVTLKVEMQIIKALKELECTHFFSLGDWFDGGYGSDVSAALAHTDIDRELASVVNGNFYGLIGNHIRINMDSNPELHLIQPHPVYTSRHSLARKEQVIRTPDSLMLNGVQISFVHHNKFAESAFDYKPLIDKSAKYHIALFHTDMIVPTTYLYRMGIKGIINDNSKISDALNGIDLAIVGHIHKPIGRFVINRTDGTSVTMVIPGSLTNTDAGLISRHDYIDMPLITIEENGSVKYEEYRMNLLTNELSFQKKEFSDSQKEKLQSLRGNNKTTLYDDLEQQSLVGGKFDAYMSLNSFLKGQGYTEADKKLIKSVMHSPEDVDALVSIFKEEHTAVE